MASVMVQRLAHEVGRSVDDVERAWKLAKQKVAEALQKDTSELAGDDFKLVTLAAKQALGLDDRLLDPTHFLKSGKSAKDYIEDVVSTSFNIPTVIIPPKPKARLKQDPDADDQQGEVELPGLKVKPHAHGPNAARENNRLDSHKNYSKLSQENLAQVAATVAGTTHVSENANNSRLSLGDLRQIEGKASVTPPSSSVLTSDPMSRLEQDLMNDIANYQEDIPPPPGSDE